MLRRLIVNLPRIVVAIIVNIMTVVIQKTQEAGHMDGAGSPADDSLEESPGGAVAGTE
jgi:hypothetical protein